MVPADIDERILKVLEGQRYLIHRNDEPDYSHFRNGSVCIEVLDASGESKLIIDRDFEYTLSFGYHHCHYSLEDDADICELAGTVDGILHNRICAVSLGHRKKNNRFVLHVSCFAASGNAGREDIETLFQETDRHRSTEMILQYWNSSKNKSIPIHRNENRAGRQRSSSGLVILLALFHRYFYHLISLVLLFRAAKSKHQFMLLMGVYLLLFAFYSFIGYVFRWKHIFCSYQNANHVRMTPSRINWDTIDKKDCIGVPIIFAVLGTAAVVISYVA